VRISSGQETKISPALVKDTPDVMTGSISVSTTPAGVSVYLNNDFQGVTPATGYLDLTDLVPGVYTILLKDSQHEDFSDSLTVTAGKITPVNVAMKAPTTPFGVNGTLNVGSSPAGAQVYLDNRFVGITPLIMTTVPPGEYNLVLKMNGYADYSNRVQIAAGMSTPATINLTVQATPAPTSSAAPSPEPTRSPLPGLLIPASLGAAFVLIRRQQI
jgi:hypothetical protein